MGMLLLIGIVVFLLTGIIFIVTKRCVVFGRILMTVAIFATAFFLTAIGTLMIAFSNVHAKFYSTVFIIFMLLISALFICILWKVIKRKFVFIPIIVGISACLFLTAGFYGYQMYIDSIPTMDDGDNLLESYAPYFEDTKVVSLDEKSDLIIENEMPKMDGATALYPIYSAFAKAVYPKDVIDKIAVKKGNVIHRGSSEYLNCSTTTNAYHNIVTGTADIIFVAGPSKEQKEFAEESGVELVYTPIGKEAFVFFVNSKNPLTDITIEQIQSIYSGQTTKWEDLSVNNFGDIKAFQRDEGSGSQTALVKLMGDRKLSVPPKENVIGGMGGIISQTADYKNYKNAIGYSFRFYSTEMVKNNQIKLLSINGIYPSLTNIENGTYPIASEFYAVTRKDASENTKKMLKWIISEQGQELIEKTGYTPVSR